MGKNQLQMSVPWYFATFAGESKFEVHGKLRKFGRRFSNRGVAERYTCRVNKSTKGEVHQFCFDEKNWLKYVFHFFPRSTWRPFLKVLREFLHRSNRFVYSSCWLDSGCQGKIAKKPKASTSPYQCLQIPRFPARSISWWGSGNGGLKKSLLNNGKVDRLQAMRLQRVENFDVTHL